MNKEKRTRKEMIIGLLLLALYGIFNSILYAPELLKGITFGVAISLIVVGGLRESTYQRLKALKKGKKI